MGITTVKLIVKNPLKPKKQTEHEFLVDTGAHYTVLPQKEVQKLELKPSFEQEFSLADGKVIKRFLSSATINFDGKELAVPVVLGEEDDDYLVGVTTLESFGVMIDPFKRQIYKSKLML